MDKCPAKKLKATPLSRFILKQGSEADLPKPKRWVKATEMGKRIVIDLIVSSSAKVFLLRVYNYMDM